MGAAGEQGVGSRQLTARLLANFIHEVEDETERLLIVGHNPGLEQLALLVVACEVVVVEANRAKADGDEQQRCRQGEQLPNALDIGTSQPVQLTSGAAIDTSPLA